MKKKRPIKVRKAKTGLKSSRVHKSKKEYNRKQLNATLAEELILENPLDQ